MAKSIEKPKKQSMLTFLGWRLLLRGFEIDLKLAVSACQSKIARVIKSKKKAGIRLLFLTERLRRATFPRPVQWHRYGVHPILENLLLDLLKTRRAP